MPSTNKTEFLGLNHWSGSDKPKREDFVGDNLIIDSALGNTQNNIESILNALSNNWPLSTWEPMLSGATTDPVVTQTVTRGVYGRLGPFGLVFGQIGGTISTIGSGIIKITTLPIQAGNYSGYTPGAGYIGLVSTTEFRSRTPSVPPNSTEMRIIYNTSTGSVATLNWSAITPGSAYDISFFLMYPVTGSGLLATFSDIQLADADNYLQADIDLSNQL